eukprot:IDg11005t1
MLRLTSLMHLRYLAAGIHARSATPRSRLKRGMCDPLTAFATSIGVLRTHRALSSASRAVSVGRESRVAANAAAWARISVRGPPMMDAGTPTRARVMDGKATAAAVRREIVRHTFAGSGALRGKRGVASFGFELPADVQQDALEALIDELNAREDVHGILVQLPLPAHIDDERALGRITLEKDVDGFHPLNIGRLCMSGRTPPLFVPCTPKGCIELLDRYGVSIEGKNAVVLGRSNIVGLPVAMLLMHRNATVTICHSRTQNVENKVREADIVIAACGIPTMSRVIG